MAGLFFVTAPDANYKIINAALFYMRDSLQFPSDHLADFRLMSDRVPIEPNPDDAFIERLREATPIPLKSEIENAWVGASVEEVESYCLDLIRKLADRPSPSQFVLLDSAGVENKTCVLGHYPYEDHDDPATFQGRFSKVRIPWDELHSVWANLDISNMNFEEFVEEEDEGDDQGWFTYQSIFDGPDLDEEGLEQRDAEFENWRQQGYI